LSKIKGKILIVDDEKNIREGLRKAIELDGYDALTAEDGLMGLKIFQSEDIDLIIADLKMPNMSGEEMLKKIIQKDKTIPVIILTGHGTIENAVETMRIGAYDFLEKPPHLKRLSLLIKRALERKKLEIENRELYKELDHKYGFDKIIGTSSAMQKVYDLVKQAAPSRSNILITGESGTGKELIANAIHRLSKRNNSPLVKVHCAALNENLLESELFGHEKGAFTGAISRKKGRFELADGGTIFLDEIGEISQSVQVKLLRVTQEKEFERVGGEETIKVDVRIISATNKDLHEEIQKGNFREDLYYRLKVVKIEMPPLRERRTDISVLVNAFIKEFAKENDKENISITPKAMSYLKAYEWPGNVRELRNIIEGAVVLTKNDEITEEDLPEHIIDNNNTQSIYMKPGMSLSEIEKIAIQSTLAYTNYNKTKAAEILGIGRKTLHRKLDEHKLK
jgi:DNA-binding NtrC family response regulator